eukprot:jgi/Botrbrau1/17737/Bobra.0127s0002.1
MKRDREAVEASYWNAVTFDLQALVQHPASAFQGVSILTRERYRRKYIWDFFAPHYSCPQKEKVGVLADLGDNGKWVCGLRTLLQKPDCIVYSFGSNGEVSFEQGILDSTNCEIHVFDPTLGPEAKATVEALPRTHFHEYGLGGREGLVKSSAQLTMGRLTGDFAIKRLGTIMQELGHTWVDVLKVDIEGSEWDFLEDILAQPGPVPFTQLQIEFHYYPAQGHNIGRIRQLLLKMLAKDLRVFSTEPNYWWLNSGYECIEYSYLQVDRKGQVVTKAGPIIL